MVAAGVDLRTTGTSAASTFTTDGNFILTGIVGVCATGSGATGNALIKIQDTSSATNLSSNVSIPVANFSTAGSVITQSSSGTQNKVIASGNTFQVVVVTAATAGTWTMDFYLIGFNVPTASVP